MPPSLKTSSRKLRGLFVLLALALTLLSLSMPTTTHALTQFSCPDGSTLRWMDTGPGISIPLVGSAGLTNYSHVCLDGSGNTTTPSETEVSSCSPGYIEALEGPLGVGSVCVPAATTQYQAPTSCSGALNVMLSPFTCMFRTLAAGTSATLIYISSWFLVVAGVLFNWLVANTIVEFSSLYGSVGNGIEVAWSAFRDIANILIIGIFTFIAISIILGLKSYGQKKMIASVLIIAVLINFSLLFTKIIVDASNYTAFQIYSAAGLDAGTISASSQTLASATNQQSASAASSGIAGQFIYLLGVQSFGDAFTAVSNIAEASDSGWVALLHGAFVMIILLAAALVLFYGSFLLVSRVIIIIFLMVTASVAFASYLIPAWAGSRYGWKTWWNSLLKSAVLAPLLMFFLWMTLTVSTELQNPANGQHGSFGDMIANPSSAPNINTLFTYILILGMLFVSFKLSSAFAGKIAGFNFAAAFTGTGIGLAGVGLGMLGRNLVGAPARERFRALRNYYNRPNTEEQNFDSRRTGVRGLMNRTALLGARGLSRTNFNPLQAKSLASVASTLGVPKALTGKKPGEGGIAGVMERKAKAADEKARAIGPTDAQRDETRALAERHERAERSRHRETLQQSQDQNENLLREVRGQRPEIEQRARQNQPERQESENRIRQHQAELTQIANERTTTRDRQQSEMRATARIIDQARREAEQQRLEGAHRDELSALSERERQTQENLSSSQEALRNLDAAAGDAAEAELRPRVEELSNAIQESTRGLRAFDRETDRAATHVGQQAVRNADVALRQSLLWDPRARSNVTDAMRNHERDDNLRRLRALVNEGQTPGGQGAQGDAASRH